MRFQKTLISPFIALCILMFMPLTATAELDKRQASALNSITRKLEQIERTIVKLETSDKKGTPAYNDNVARQSKSQARRFESVLKQFDKLPADDADVQAAMVRLESLQQRLAALASVGEAATQQKAELDAQWQALRNSEEYQADQQVLYGFAEVSDFMFELKNRRFSMVSDEEFRETMSLLENWDTVKTQVANLRKKYEAFGRRASMAQIDSIEKEFAAIEEKMAYARQEGLNFLKQKDQEMRSEIAKALKLKEEADAAGRPSQIDYQLIEVNQFVPSLVRHVRRSSEFLKKLAPAQSANIQTQVDEAVGYYDGIVDSITEEIIANKGAPIDNYNGPDVAELKAFAAKRFASEGVIGVYLQGNWERIQKYRWDPSMSAMVKIDKSSLSGHILLKLDSKFALERRIEIEKDHLANDRLQLFGDFQAHPNPRPGQKVLLNKL